MSLKCKLPTSGIGGEFGVEFYTWALVCNRKDNSEMNN